MARTPSPAKAAEPEKPTEPAKPVGNRRYKVLSMVFIEGRRFKPGSVERPNYIVMPDGTKMSALEPGELTDEPLSVQPLPRPKTMPWAEPSKPRAA
jgi:hypothetical protein